MIEIEKSSDTSPPPPSSQSDVRQRIDHNRRDESISSGEQKISDGQQSTSTSGQSILISKYSCQFCAYKSPYKGNVKRHLALVHKMEKQRNE